MLYMITAVSLPILNCFNTPYIKVPIFLDHKSIRTLVPIASVIDLAKAAFCALDSLLV